MVARLTIAFVCFTAFVPNSSADVESVSRKQCNHISRKLKRLADRNKISSRDLVVQVQDGAVTVTGQVGSIRESHKILKSITSTDGVTSINLNLGVGRAPQPAPLVGIRPAFGGWPSPPELQWDDGWWQLNFGTPKSSHIAKP